ncbi:hypothetical protein I316_04953 [Kwoniella heveanensis BCC8398]|uniref:Uncharacterized protein n=1 Tax=Kwoniella heveanensis BCC8398 TaxID=1296120 RepID=A0A1B9GQ78_9TREE|nr:hypothetical protein I316_04953 [Kwoniella heveanensis BCC8398]
MATPTTSPHVTVETSWITPFPSTSYIVVQTLTYADYAVGDDYDTDYSSSVASPTVYSGSSGSHKATLNAAAATSSVQTPSYYTDFTTYVSAATSVYSPSASPSGSYDQTYGYSQDSGMNTTSVADMEGSQGNDNKGDHPPISRGAGIAIASVVGLLVIGSCIGCCFYRRRRRRLNAAHGGQKGEKGSFFGRTKKQLGVQQSETNPWGEIDVLALPSPTSSATSSSPLDEQNHHLFNLQRARSGSGRSGSRRLSHRDLRHVVLSRPQPAVLYGNPSQSPTSATSLTSASPFMDPPLNLGLGSGSMSDLHRTQSQFASEYDFNSRRSESTYTDGTEYDMLAHDGSSYARTLSTYSEGVNSEYSERDLGYLPPVSAGPGTDRGTGVNTNTSTSTGSSTLVSGPFGRVVGSSRNGDRKDPNGSDFGMPGTSGSGSGTVTSGTLSSSSGWTHLPSSTTQSSPTTPTYGSGTTQYPPSRSLTPSSYGNLNTANNHNQSSVAEPGRSNSTRPLLSISATTSPFADPSPTAAASNPFEVGSSETNQERYSYVPGSPASGRSWRTEDEMLLRASSALSPQDRYASGQRHTGSEGGSGSLRRGLTIVRHTDGGSANYHHEEDDGDNDGIGSIGAARSEEMHLPPSYEDIYHTR